MIAKNKLGNTVPVAQIEKHHPFVISNPIHPTA